MTSHVFCVRFRAADKTQRASTISDTKKVAQHLLPLVLAELKVVGASGQPPTLAVAVERAVATACSAFTAAGINPDNIKDVCSGRPGGLGKAKVARGPKPIPSPTAAAGVDSDPDGDAEPAAVEATV